MRRKPSFGEIKCKECGKMFLPRSGATRYCSKECRLAVKRRQGASDYRKTHPNARPIDKIGKSTSDFEIDGTTLKITTSKGGLILADAEDAGVLMKLSWSVSKAGYAVAYVDGRLGKMHRVILGDYLSSEDDVDHINRRKLDNRKKNLRICKRAENLRNSGERKNNSGHTGVTVLKNGLYRATITLDGKQIHLGVYKSLDEAIRAREEGETKYHGSFARHIGTELARKETDEKKGL